MRKFRASMEPFWNLKLSKYVEGLTPVSSEYIKSWVPLSPTSTAGWTSRVLLADVIPWINKASLVLYIARMLRALCHAATNLTFGRCAALLSSPPVIEALKLISFKVENRSQTLRLWRRRGIDVAADCALTICWRPLPYYALCSYWGCGQVFITLSTIIL